MAKKKNRVIKALKEERFLRQNWDKFLRAYYLQECEGCPDGHSSFWKTIIESKEWQEWKDYCFKKYESGKWDFSECEELGIMSKQHWQEFIRFIKMPTRSGKRGRGK